MQGFQVRRDEFGGLGVADSWQAAVGVADSASVSSVDGVEMVGIERMPKELVIEFGRIE